jgi:hypothetical protein
MRSRIDFYFWREFSHLKKNLKNMISTHSRDFSGKLTPIHQILKLKKKIAQFFATSSNMQVAKKKILISHVVYSQI